MVKALPAPLGLNKKPLPDLSTSRLGALGSVRSLGSLASSAIPGNTVLKAGSGSNLLVTSSLDGPRLSNMAPLSSSEKPLSKIRKEQPDATADAKPAPSENDDTDKKEYSSNSRNIIRENSRDRSAYEQDKSLAPEPALAASSAEESGSQNLVPPMAVTTGIADPRPKSSHSNRKDDIPVGGMESIFAGPVTSADLQFYRDRCSELERLMKESEMRVADYRTSYTTAKDDLLALERRYEASQAQWKDKLRAVEVERDAADSERRRLKFELLDRDGERGGSIEVTPSSGTEIDHEASCSMKNTIVRLEAEQERLKKEVLSAEAALARSASAHAELQERFRESEIKHRDPLSSAEAQSETTDRVEADLKVARSRIIDLEEQLSRLERRSPPHTTNDLATEIAEKDKNITALKKQLLNEEDRCKGFLGQIQMMGQLSEQQARSALDQKTELAKTIEDLQAKLSVTSIELDALRAHGSINAGEVASESQARSPVEITEEFQLKEQALRRQLNEKDRKISEQQEVILILQAEKSLQAESVESGRSAQFETFASQATAVRKSLKTEIENLKGQVQDLESEKSGLLTQLTRLETALQFAKKELNDVAALRESCRQHEVEKQQLLAQCESVRAALARQVNEEASLKTQIDRLQLLNGEMEGKYETLRAENSQLISAMETERAVIIQKDKQIKSYQGELLQLQRRLAENSVSPLKDSSLPASPVFFQPPNQNEAVSVEVSAARLDLENARCTIDKLQHDLAEKEKNYNQLSLTNDQLRAKAADMISRLDAQSAELDELRISVAARQAENSTAAQLSSTHTSRLNEVEQKNLKLESEKAALLGQLRDTRSQLSSAELSVELLSSSSKLAADEVASYKEKWITSERELSELRLQLTQVASTAEVEATSLRNQLAYTQSNLEKETVAAGSVHKWQLEAENLRAALLRREAQLVAAQEELTHKTIPAAPTAGVARHETAEAILPDKPAVSAESHHIVTLSMELGRQQANMQRLEEHLRKTENLMREFKGLTGTVPESLSLDDSVLPSSVRQQRRVSRRPARTAEGVSPESMSLLPARDNHRTADSSSDSSLSPVRPNRKPTSSQRWKGERTVKESSSAGVSTERITGLIRKYDLDVNDMKTIDDFLPEGNMSSHLRSAATRAFSEGKARLKRESKFLVELQEMCAAAKASLVRDQAYVRNLKALWRGNRGSSLESAVSTDGINAVTMRLNAEVDVFREAQLLAKSVERRTKSLAENLRALEEALLVHRVNLSEPQLLQHYRSLLSASRLVQKRCADSAAEMTAVTARQCMTMGDIDEIWSPTAATQRHHVKERVKFEDTYYALQHDVNKVREATLPASLPPATEPQRAQPGALGSIRSNETKARILQDQINKIADRQNQSKAACEKHAG